MSKFETINELKIKVSNTQETLIDESCCTALTICLNNEGDVFTSFVGAYNPEIIKMLSKVQRTYFKNLIKKLKKQNQEVVNNITGNADVKENATPAAPQKKEKVKKVHERDKKKEETTEQKSETTKDKPKTTKNKAKEKTDEKK